MKRFYVDLLGFAIEWEPDADNVYLTSGSDNLALHRAPEMIIPVEDDAATLPAPGGALDHLGLIVRTADDVDRWAAFLESRGVAIAAAPRTHRDGARSCYFRDPDATRSRSSIIRRSAGRSESPHLTTVRRSRAGAYIRSEYSLTIRREEKRGAFDRIASLTVATQRRGTAD